MLVKCNKCGALNCGCELRDIEHAKQEARQELIEEIEKGVDKCMNAKCPHGPTCSDNCIGIMDRECKWWQKLKEAK